MRRMSIFFISVFLLGVVHGIQQAFPKVLVRTGHIGVVTELQYDKSRKALFSLGDNGLIKIWQRNSGQLLQQLQSSAGKIAKIAIQPGGALLATVGQSSTGQNWLEIWDWRSGNRLQKLSIAEKPIYIGFTSLGSWLIYTTAKYDSVMILDPYNGEYFTGLPEGFGIVSFVATSTNEQTVMTYQPTGIIRYWNINNKTLKAEIETVPGLQNISLTPDKKFLVGRVSNEIFIVNVIDGSLSHRLSISENSQFTVSNQIPLIHIIEPSPPVKGGDVTIKRVRIDRVLRTTNVTPLGLSGNPTAIVGAEYSLFIAQEHGIVEHSIQGLTFFAKNELLSSVEIALNADTTIIATPRYIVLNNTDLPIKETYYSNERSDKEHIQKPGTSTVKIVHNPFLSTIGITVMATDHTKTTTGFGEFEWPITHLKNTVLIWNREGEKGHLGSFDTITGAYRPLLENLPLPLKQVSIFDGLVILVNVVGEISIYLISDLIQAALHKNIKPIYKFNIPGAEKVVGLNSSLYVVRNKALTTGEQLLKIDIKNGETTVFSNIDMMIYDIALLASGSLMAIGLESRSDDQALLKLSTVLKSLNGRGLSKQQTIHRYNDEDLFASLTASPNNRYLYTSIGLNNIQVWNGRRLYFLPTSNHRPRKLAANSKHIISLNEDLTYTVWDRSTYKLLFDLYLFHDLNWLVVFPSGEHLNSSGATRYLSKVY